MKFHIHGPEPKPGDLTRWVDLVLPIETVRILAKALPSNNMRRQNLRRLVIATLHAKGPLTDAELAWWVGVALKQNPETAKKKRWELTRQKEVRFAGKVRITESGRVQKMWEVLA